MMSPDTMGKLVWDTVVDIATKEYGLGNRQAQVYAWCCCARGTWKDWEKLEH